MSLNHARSPSFPINMNLIDWAITASKFRDLDDRSESFFGFDLIVFFPDIFCRPLTKRRQESNPGRLGEARTLPLCYAVPPAEVKVCNYFEWLSQKMKKWYPTESEPSNF